MPNRTCTIPGCEKPARSARAEWCAMHYHRWYRYGDPGEVTPRRRAKRGAECTVEGCDGPDEEAGMCSKHAARVRRHGDPLTVIAHAERALPKGDAHHAWKGVDAGYGAAHDRVRRARGSASLHRCIDCGDQAAHWSYDHADPNENLAHGHSAHPVAYSTDPAHYDPRCVRCHKAFDLGRPASAPTPG